MLQVKERVSDDAVVETAKAVVAEYGADFRYTMMSGGLCWYSPETAKAREPTEFEKYPELPKFKTGCLVGVILDRLGVSGHHESTDGVVILVGYLNKDFSEFALEFMSILQATQDRGGTWGQALDRALKCERDWKKKRIRID